MASITKQGPLKSMAASTVSTRPHVTFTALNLRLGFLRLVALLNGVILLLVLYALHPASPDGILGPLLADLGRALPDSDPNAIRFMAGAALGFVFFADISQSMRRLPPSYGLLACLSGQAILTVITAVYVLAGQLPSLALYGTGGTLALSAVGMITVIQSYRGVDRIAIRTFLYPMLSAVLGCLGMSLIFSPDSATRAMIETTYGPYMLAALLALLAWGCGQLRQNHLTPDRMVKRLVGLALFPLSSLHLLTSSEPVSLLGVFLPISTALLAMALAFVLAEIERVEYERQAPAKDAQTGAK